MTKQKNFCKKILKKKKKKKKKKVFCFFTQKENLAFTEKMIYCTLKSSAISTKITPNS